VMWGDLRLKHLNFSKVFLLTLAMTFVASVAISDGDLQYGSKVDRSDLDEASALSPFYMGPEFAFWDVGIRGIFDPEDPVYINIVPSDNEVSENDVRLTPFGDFPAGSQVNKADNDIGKTLTKFGSGTIPLAEPRYLDVNGDKAYSLEDPVYLDINPGKVSSNDVRISNYKGLPAGARVTESDSDNDLPTTTLPVMLSFFNTNGNINNGGFAIYDEGDMVYMDTQYPFYVVTINDVRMSF